MTTLLMSGTIADEYDEAVTSAALGFKTDLWVQTQDMPPLRSRLVRELAPLLYPSGPPDWPRWICVAVSDVDAAEGGLIGLATGAWFSIDLLWLPLHRRGRGLGSAVLAKAEQEAARLGCVGATVGTTSAEARRFYEQRSYVARLELPEIRPGLTQTTLQKTFRGAQAVSDGTTA